MRKITRYILIVLVIFHVVGCVLFYLNPETASLSYVNLLLVGGALIVHEKRSRPNLFLLSIIFVFGFFFELIGVKTGWLFGNYHYGSSLGFKVFDVPLIIGLNWIIVIISSCSIAQMVVRYSKVQQSLLAAFLCLVLDFLIEPVAIRYDFWQWENGTIPIYNYFCWFAISALFSYFYLLFSEKMNDIGKYVYLLWIVFFSTLNLL
jgi:putative membrane protein